MIIAIDIGNTNTGLALILDKKILVTESVPTGFRRCDEQRLTSSLRRLSKKAIVTGNDHIDVIVCSVVPKALVIVKRCVKQVFHTRAQVIGKDFIVPMTNTYDDPLQVGQDRLVCAYAAAEMYGVPAVVVDLGTAITFDVLSAKKEYFGGLIAPGIRLSAETLFDQTALLPKVVIQKPKQVIGKNTQESILSGMFYGYGEMIKGVVDLLVKELGQDPKIIVTGGFSDVMINYIPHYPCIVNRDLIFHGIALIVAHGA